MLVFEERGKPEYPEKNLSEQRREENQQQTQPTYCVEIENRSRATSVGGECSHHCAIPAPQMGIIQRLQTLQNSQFWSKNKINKKIGITTLIAGKNCSTQKTAKKTPVFKKCSNGAQMGTMQIAFAK